MAEVITNLSIQEKLRILSDAAKYDVACTSSGVDRAGVKGAMGSTSAAGICHSFAGDGRCISLLKILYTNECVYDCKYCINRRSNDVVRTSFTPEEVCTLTMEFYKRNYIEGLFLSSGIIKSPDNTMGLLYETLYLLRKKYRFMGYIHVKGIPGADPLLIEKIGFLADRMSLNLELPTAEGLKKLAPHKTEGKILSPMRHIQEGIHGNEKIGLSAYQATRISKGKFELPGYVKEENASYTWEHAVPKEKLISKKEELQTQLNLGEEVSKVMDGEVGISSTGVRENSAYGILHGNHIEDDLSKKSIWLPENIHKEDRNWLANGRYSDFVPAGQSTQMIVGATGETDYQIMAKAEQLYQGYDLKRVFFSAFINTTGDAALPETPEGPPLLREHRLYQTDWLLRYYGFQTSEILDKDHPNLDLMIDPKCQWALRHLDQFPVEVNVADYGTILRVPGIGVKSARRIIQARKTATLDFDHLKRMGVVLKRAHYFLTCKGRLMYQTKIEENFIRNELVSMDRKKNWEAIHRQSFTQMDLFSDFSMKQAINIETERSVITGQL